MPREAEAEADSKNSKETTTTTTKGFYNESVKNPQKFANKKKSLISCQVVGFASVENALLVKMKSEKATEFIAKLKSLAVGTVVEGIIKSHDKRGAVVHVNDPVTIVAHVEWHLIDNRNCDVKEAQSLYPIDSSIRGRVLKVDVKEGSVTLTCQSALVNSSLPILESVREVVISRVYAGSVCHLFPNSDSALVKFYNGVTGILFLKQALYPIELFYVGCPVLVKVTKVDLGQNKLFLSLERFDLSYVNHGGTVGNDDVTTSAPESPGSVVNCDILRHSSRGALVRLPSGRLSMLQRTHLSDFPEFFGALSSSSQTGDKISVVVVNTEMVSAKKELIAYAEEHPTPSEWQREDFATDDPSSQVIQAGKTYPLIVLDQKYFGLFAVLYNGRRAFVPNKLLTSMTPAKATGEANTPDAKTAPTTTTMPTKPPSSMYAVGQTLLGTVKLIDPQESRLVVNTKRNACDPHSLVKSRSIFANYLEEKSALSRGRGGEKIGATIEVKVLEVDADSVKCTHNVVVEGAVNRPNEVTVGDTVEAMIIDYDPVGDTLYGSLIPALIENGKLGNPDCTVGDAMSVNVIRIASPRYLVVYKSPITSKDNIESEGAPTVYFVGI